MPTIPKTPVFRIVWKDEKPECVVAELDKKVGAWWHIRHKDGSVTKHNGGAFGKDDPAWFLGRWQETVRGAWLNEANRWFVLAGIESEAEHRSSYRARHWAVVKNAMADAFEYGKIVSAIEATTKKKGTP